MSIGHQHPICCQLRHLLSDYLDGELEAALCAEIEAHLAGCPDCQVLVDTVRKTIILYRSQALAELPTDVKDRLYQVLNLPPAKLKP